MNNPNKTVFYCKRLNMVINLLCERAPIILKDQADSSETILTFSDTVQANYEDDHCIEALKRLIETGEAQNVGMTFEIRLLIPLSDYKPAFTLTQY